MMGYVRYYLKHLFNYLTYPFRFLFRVPTEIIAAPRYILGMSLPVRVAVILAIFIPLLTLLAYLGFYFQGARSDSAQFWTILTLVILCNIAIPIVAFYAVKLWLEPPISDFPDIDEAFDAGIEKLEENNFDLRSLPVFLVLGPPSSEQAKALFDAAKMETVISGVPRRSAPYLVCP